MSPQAQMQMERLSWDGTKDAEDSLWFKTWC